MLKKIILCCLLPIVSMAQIRYPETKKVKQIDQYYETDVAAPYRWLEDGQSQETKDWIVAQNKTTFTYLNRITFRNNIKKRLEELWNYEKIGAPFNEGAYTYYYKNDGLQNQDIVYRRKENKEEIFLNPNQFSKDGTTSLSDLKFSKDSKTAAYAISENGSDWRKIIIIDVESKAIIEDTLVDVKFSTISWYKNEGFYYASYDKPKGNELSAKTDQHKVYYHKLGTSQKDDVLIFGNKHNEKYKHVRLYLTEDDNYLALSASASTSGNKLFIKDLSKKNAKLITVSDNFDSDTHLIKNKGEKLYLITNLNAPNRKIVTVDITNPSSENWKDFIPETENVLTIFSGSGYFFVRYYVDAVSKIFQYDLDGNLIREIKLPGIGTVIGFKGKTDAKELYFSFNNYNTPNTSYKFNPKNGTYETYWKPSISFKSDDYVSNQVFYTSKDGTRIPMIITHKKGIVLNGKNPTILHGYGGFNVALTPNFSVANAVWMEQGGIYAVPNLRGGGEYGKKWHNAGTRLQKQNVFDDFIAAAEYLIENKYTSSDFLAISGHSNGGLLVGATMTQRPDLMKVALPSVGLLDMLRYHLFTVGSGWASEYGTVEDSKEMFDYLKNYSPVHNVKKGTTYPATLITTGDHDDRVVPAHSYKFVAELQEKQTGTNPILIRIETNTGHGIGTPVSKTIAHYTDIFSFTLFNMDINAKF